jgi:transcriptional regulator with XRE-family HTH domain
MRVLAKSICSVSYLSKIENNTVIPSDKIINHLWSRLGVPPYNFVRMNIQSYFEKSEKMKQMIPFILISLLLLFGCSLDSDATFSSEDLFSVNDIKIGDSLEHVESKFGLPDKTTLNDSRNTYVYNNNGPGMMITLTKDKVSQIEVVVDYIKEEWNKIIPLTKQNVIEFYGDKKETEMVSCYHTASCENWIYQTNNESLEVLFKRDNESVEKILLKKSNR